MGPIPKRKTARAPAVDKLLKPAIGVALAVFAYIFLQGLNSEIPRVDVSDELLLREVFFGEGAGKNYAVLCHSPPKENDPSSSSIPISSVFQDARNDGSAPAEFFLLDCEHVLPSGKSVIERFDLDLKKRPTVFVSGKVGPPKQIPLKHLKTGGMLVKLLRGLLEPRATKIENTKQLKSKCLNKPHCALLLKGKTPENYLKDAMQNLVVQYPDIQFASIDSTVLLLGNLEEHLEEFERGAHRFVFFKKVSGGLEVENKTEGTTGSGRLITSVASFEGKNFKHSALSSFVSKAVKGSIQLKKMPALPVVKTRTKKMEEQEKKKRQRMKDRKVEADKKRQQQQQQEQTFSDGSKEARRAERARRMEEHRKEHGVKERTPEEIAEREKARRKRMAEEAEKWNMVPEDAPEMGDIVEEEEDYDIEDEGFVDFEEEDEEDDEDILDLD